MALILQIVSDPTVNGSAVGQPVIERGLEYALEMLGNFAREREGRKCITRSGFWQTALDTALKTVQDAVMNTASAEAEAGRKTSASDSHRHVLVLLCRLYVKKSFFSQMCSCFDFLTV